MKMSSVNLETDKSDKEEKYTKGLLSSLGHLLGLRVGRDGKLHVTVDDNDNDRNCVSIENINRSTAQQWKAGALLNTVADLNILPPEKVQTIRKRVEDVAKNDTGFTKPSVPTSGSSSLTTGAGVGATKVSNQEEDPFAFSKGPSGFYAPRKVQTTTPSINAVTTNNSRGAISTDIGQKKQFMFGKSKSIETETTSAEVNSNRGCQSLFSSYEQPTNKKPALGGGNRPVPEDSSGYQKPITGYMGRGVNRWNNPPTGDTSANEEESQPEATTGAFKTAYEQLLIDDKRKGIQRTIPPGPTGGGTATARASGLRRPFPRAEPERNPKQPNSDDEGKVSDNPEVQELMSHESMKNIDPKMVEAIMNEVMQVATTSWDDIAGLEGVKRIIREIIIWPMERPDIFTGLRAAPRGILFFGPPGTGKTMFGRVIATESRSTFFNISASSLTSKWIGDGEKMVRALFAVARLKQPSVIFIDEIDSILTQRSDTEHESSRRLKTEFLIQFDGAATSTQDRILVIGVTNRPQELDEAARRRLVKRIYIPLPDFVARKQLVKNLIQEYTSNLTEVDFDKIAKLTEGYSGADMTSLCREAAYGPIREVGHLLQSLDLNSVRPMKMKDFTQAQRQVKSSVASSDVTLYEDWDIKFGCHIGEASSGDSTQMTQDD